MNKYFISLSVILLIVISSIPKRTDAQLLNGYNQQLYTSVFDAAEGVAMPFLLQQGYMTLPGVTIYNDTMLMYNGQAYTLNNLYQNPESGNPNNYYLDHSLYGQYQIEIFTNVWHINIPNVFYNYIEHSFSSLADCVGYGTRVLSSVGDTTENGNGYLSLIKILKTANTTVMAARGFVASAYEIGAGFPTLPDNNPGSWEYISGNVIADSIDAYNHRLHPSVGQYNGRVKGGYNFSRKGDILGFAYGPGGESNGHFMVMADDPYQVNFDTLNRIYPNVPDTSIQSFLNTYNVWATPVYDCSGQKAHFYDSRIYTSGIGHGVLWILTDPSTNTPQGLIFKEPASNTTQIYTQMLDVSHTWAISVGRYNVDNVGIGNTGINGLPLKVNLAQNYPNPFNPETKIRFDVPKAANVELIVYDAGGKEVEKLINNDLNAGSYESKWNASRYASGVYFYTLRTGSISETRKMVVIK